MSPLPTVETKPKWHEKLLRELMPVLVAILVIATVVAMLIAVLLAFEVAPDLRKKVNEHAIDAVWKLVVAIGGAAGLLLGWLVKHLHAVDLVKATSSAKIFENYVNAEHTFEATILGKLIQEQIDNRLTVKKVLIDAALEPFRQQILFDAAQAALEQQDAFEKKKEARDASRCE